MYLINIRVYVWVFYTCIICSNYLAFIDNWCRIKDVALDFSKFNFFFKVKNFGYIIERCWPFQKQILSISIPVQPLPISLLQSTKILIFLSSHPPLASHLHHHQLSSSLLPLLCFGHHHLHDHLTSLSRFLSDRSNSTNHPYLSSVLKNPSSLCVLSSTEGWAGPHYHLKRNSSQQPHQKSFSSLSVVLCCGLLD